MVIYVMYISQKEIGKNRKFECVMKNKDFHQKYTTWFYRMYIKLQYEC